MASLRDDEASSPLGSNGSNREGMEKRSATSGKLLITALVIRPLSSSDPSVISDVQLRDLLRIVTMSFSPLDTNNALWFWTTFPSRFFVTQEGTIAAIKCSAADANPSKARGRVGGGAS